MFPELERIERERTIRRFLIGATIVVALILSPLLPMVIGVLSWPVVRLTHPHHSAPPQNKVFQDMDTLSIAYIGQAHIERSGNGKRFKLPDGGISSITLDKPNFPSDLLQTSEATPCRNPIDGETYDYKIDVYYHGMIPEIDEIPRFAYSSTTRRLVYLNRPGECATASKEFQMEITSLRKQLE